MEYASTPQLRSPRPLRKHLNLFIMLGALLIICTLNFAANRPSNPNAFDVSKREKLVQERHRCRSTPCLRRMLIDPTFPAKVANTSINGNRLCAQLNIALDMTNFTLPFARGALEWMLNSALGSLKNQTSTRSAWPSTWQAILSISDKTVNGALLAEHYGLVDETLSEPIRKLQQEGIHLFMTRNPGSALKRLAMENPLCAWVANIRLDADDVLAPGYLEYISNNVVKQLEQTTTFKGDPWLGAVLAPRRLNRVVLGHGICMASMMERKVFAGYSVGQATLVSVSVFATLGYSAVSGDHTAVLQLLRNEVTRKVLRDVNYSSRAGRLPALNKSTNLMEDGFQSYNEAYDKMDEAQSRITFIDIRENSFGPVHPYLVTPLSGHFPWGELNELPPCTLSQMKQIQGGFGYNIDFAFAGMKILEPIQLIDACRSNIHFRKAAKEMFSSDAENCFQMVQRRLVSTMSLLKK